MREQIPIKTNLSNQSKATRSLWIFVPVSGIQAGMTQTAQLPEGPGTGERQVLAGTTQQDKAWTLGGVTDGLRWLLGNN